MTTRYSSRTQIIEHQKAELERLRCESLLVEYEAPTTPPIKYREMVGEEGYPSASPCDVPRGFMADHYQFLCRIRDHSESGLKQNYDALGWGVPKGNRVLAYLKKSGCLTVKEVRSKNRLGGAPRKVATPTPKGIETLTAYEQRA